MIRPGGRPQLELIIARERAKRAKRRAAEERRRQRLANQSTGPPPPTAAASPTIPPDVKDTPAMARGRKPKIRPALLTDPNILRQIDSDLREAEQDRDDAAMSVAGQYKAAEKRGVHREAFKRARRYAKMSADKFRDEWRAMMAYVPILCADHLAQPDLLESTALSTGNVASDEPQDEPLPLDGDTEGEGEGGDGDDADQPEGDDAGSTDEAQPGPEADWQEPLVAAADSDLQNAGAVFNAGRQAGRDGEEPSTNPHALDSAMHALWARGYAQGLEEGPLEAAPEVEEPRAPSRRRPTRVAAAVVH